MEKAFKERLMRAVCEVENIIESGLKAAEITPEEYNALNDERADLYITLDNELAKSKSVYHG